MPTSVRKDSFLIYHIRNFSIILFSFTFLPLSCIIVITALILTQFSLFLPRRRTLKKDVPRILVTGVGMAKGLFLARTLYLGGCEVYGADFDRSGNLHCGRFSRAIKKFFPLKNPLSNGINAYVDRVIEIIDTEQINLWISCSGVLTAIEDGILAREITQKTKCKVFQPDEDTISQFHDKMKFMEKISELRLSNIEWHFLLSHKDIPIILSKLKKSAETSLAQKFIIKSADIDAIFRNSLPLINSHDLQNAEKVLNELDYSSGHKWLLQEFIDTSEEYCSQAVVVNGSVRAFTACPSSSVLLHYKQLDSGSILYQEMLQFTQSCATGFGNITGHISFDFLARSQRVSGGLNKTLVPIECNPRCHTATVLFNGKEAELADRYLEVLFGEKNIAILHAESHAQYGLYWIAYDLVVLAAHFVFAVLDPNSTSWTAIVRHILEFLDHILTWKDPTFTWWDPLPWFVLNHLYWPWELALTSLNKVKWKKLNVSTGKVIRYYSKLD